MAVLLGDLDDFKDVNDLRGHHVGDLALQRAARLLSDGKRSTDTAARVGRRGVRAILARTPGRRRSPSHWPSNLQVDLREGLR